MANTLIGYDNRIDSATVTGGSYQTTLPLANVQDRRLSKRARTTGLSATRAGSATYYSASGRLSYAAANIFRLNYDPENPAAAPLPLAEDAVTNVMQQSESLDTAYWGKNNASIAANVATAPDGTATADKIIENAALAEHSVTQGFTSTAQTYTASVFLKAGERTWAFVKIWDGTSNHIAYINLSPGAIGTTSGLIASGIQSLPNGWFRVWVTAALAASAGSSLTIAATTADATWTHTGDGASGLYAWGAQVEAGGSATSYVPSQHTFTSRASTATYFNASGVVMAAASNVARNSYNPSDLSAPSKLIVEAAATNIVRQSESLDTTPWWSSQASVTAGAATAPDGTATADKIVENTAATAVHGAGQTLTTTPQTYTASVFLKAGERTWAMVRMMDGTTDHYTYVNLSTGALGTAANLISRGAQVLPNGWIRVWITAVMAASVSSYVTAVISTGDNGMAYTGDGASGIYAWGAQVEAGAYPSSYIPTTTAAVTRAADVASSAAGTRAADALDARIDIALPAAAGIGLVALAGFNLSAAALFRVKGYSTPTSASTYDSGWRPAWPVPGNYGEMPGLCLAQPNAVLRYWRIEIYDPANPDGFVEFGRVFVGKAWQPATNADYGWSLAYEDETVVEAAISGAEYFDQRPTFRVMRFGYSWLGEADAATAQDVVRLSGVSGDVVVAWDAASLTTGWQRSFLGRLRTLGALENPDPVRYSMAFEVRETVA